MALRQVFERRLAVKGWFGETATQEGWFDRQFTAESGAPSPVIGSASASASGTSASVTLPTWTAGLTGTIVLVTTAASNGNTVTTPSGYTYITDFITNSSVRMYVFTKAMADSDSGSSVAPVWSATNRYNTAVVVVRDHSYDTFASGGSGSVGLTLNVPTITPGGATGIALGFYGGRSNTSDVSSVVATHPSGYTNTTATATTTAAVRNSILGASAYAFTGSSVPATSGTATSSDGLSLNTRHGLTVTLLPASGDGTFTTTASADTADGGSTAFQVSVSFDTTVSADTSDGGSSAFTGTATFSTTVSADNAAGGSSSLTGDAQFASTAGGETASGGSTTFDVSGGDATFTTTIGGETGDGGSSSFTGTATFATTVSADTGSGGSSSFTGTATFTTSASADTADGGSTTATGTATFSTVAGGESAAGGSSTFTGSGGAVPTHMGSVINSASGSSVSVTLPTWTAGATGVILLATMAATNGNTCSTPTGFTYVTDFISNSSSRTYLFRKDMADGDSGASVASAWSATNRIAAAAVVISNVTYDTNATLGAGSGTTINVPTVTASAASGLEVVFFGGRTDAGDTTTDFSATPSGYSNAQTIKTTATGSNRNILLGSATVAFEVAVIAATTATVSASINSRAGVSVALLGSGASSSDATFTTTVSLDTASGGVTDFVGTANNGTFTTTVATGTADGGPTSFSTAVVDATFTTVRTLNFPPPSGWESWTTYNIGATGGPYVLNDSTDYKIVFTAVRTAVCDIRGGRNLVIMGMPIGGRKTAPALTSSYDASGRGLRIQDGSTANNPRTIHIEGLYVEEDTYQSDTIQVALRTENDVKIVVQNLRDNGINWGNNTTSPNVHADVIQTYGGPTTLIVDGLVALHATYQGIIVNPSDGRVLPTGTPETWQFKRMYIAGDNLTGYGVKYLLYNNMPGHPAFGWTPIENSQVYLSGSSRDVTDSSGDWPSSGVTQNTVAPSDFVPEGLFTGASHTYTSPGYTDMATASGGSTSFTTSPGAVFTTAPGSATADGEATDMTGTSSSATATFTTVVGSGFADGTTASWSGTSPADATWNTVAGSAVADGGTGSMYQGGLTGFTVDLTETIQMTRMWTIRFGYTAWKIGSVWHYGHTPDDTQLAGATAILRGGYENTVDVTTGLELQAAGVPVVPVYTT